MSLTLMPRDYLRPPWTFLVRLVIAVNDPSRVTGRVRGHGDTINTIGVGVECLLRPDCGVLESDDARRAAIGTASPSRWLKPDLARADRRDEPSSSTSHPLHSGGVQTGFQTRSRD